MKNMILLAILGICSAHKGVLDTETLSVRQINEDGFGDETNNYAFAMESFQDSLYVATLNAVSEADMLLFFWGFPFETKGTQIWKGTRTNNGNGDGNGNGKWTWENKVKDGNGNINNYGMRKLVAIGNYMYGVTTNHIDGFEIWRTTDGETWEVIMRGGFNDKDNTSGRGLLAYGDYLYFGVENRRTGAKIWRRQIDTDGDFTAGSEFEEVVNDGIGDTFNYWFSDFVAYKGYMYIGTLNMNGMQLFRTIDGRDYEQIFDGGNGNPFNTAAMKLRVYHDKLYIGTMNFRNGASLYVNTDDDGKIFETVFTGGNGNRNNAYVWYIDEFNDRLYCGTFKTPGPSGVGQIDGPGQFDLFSSSDPSVEEFVNETTNGFGNEYQYGTRTMKNHGDYLMIGSATGRGPTGCQVYEASVFDGVSNSDGRSENIMEIKDEIVKGKDNNNNNGLENINWIVIGLYVGVLTVVFNVIIGVCKHCVVNGDLGVRKEKYVSDL